MLTIENNDIQKVVNGEPLFVKADNDNIVILSEAEYNNMLKAKHNEEYLTMLDKSISEIESGNIIMKTMEELEAMANE